MMIAESGHYALVLALACSGCAANNKDTMMEEICAARIVGINAILNVVEMTKHIQGAYAPRPPYRSSPAPKPVSSAGSGSKVASGRRTRDVLVVFDQLRGDYLARWAEHFGAPFRMPASHPMRTVRALRGLLTTVDGIDAATEIAAKRLAQGVLFGPGVAVSGESSTELARNEEGEEPNVQ